MTSLRDIVRRHVENETLIDYLGNKFNSTTKSEKDRLLNKLRTRGEIDRSVDQILTVFLSELEKNSPKKKRRRLWSILYALTNTICTAMIGYALRINNWDFVWFLIALFAIVHVTFISFADN